MAEKDKSTTEETGLPETETGQYVPITDSIAGTSHPEDSKTHTSVASPYSNPLDKSLSTSIRNTTHTNSPNTMATNTLANLRSCVKEFDPNQTTDVLNLSKRYTSWLDNFEACAQFEEVPAAKMKPAILALGGESFREVCKTLAIATTDTYEQMKEKLERHFTPKKNTSAERFKFFNMRPESTEETHDRWVTRLRLKVGDCEFDKFNDEEAIKLVVMLHTHNATLQRNIISKDLDFAKTIEQARALELTDRELAKIKDSGTVIGANKVGFSGSGRQQGYRRRGASNRHTGNTGNNTCRNCGDRYPYTKDEPCRAANATCHKCHSSST